MKSYDIIIIGAGPGGYETALEAAKRGKSVVLFNGSHLGGTCLNEGCIPTKCLCKNAEVVDLAREAFKFGLDELTFKLDYNKILDRKNEVVETLRSGIEMMLKSSKIDVINAFAHFKDDHSVIATIDGTEVEYHGEYIIIATGSESRSLPIPGHDLGCVKDSSDMLSIDYVPESLTIIGGGVIGMEFAGIFSSLGSQVTVIEFMKQILPPFDSDIAKRLKQAMSKRGVKIITSATAKKIEQNSEYQIIVTYEAKGKEETTVSSDLLMAVGRTPMLNGLEAGNAGVEYTINGIPVNDNMQTNVPHIFAIGDVNARMMLAHVATFQGFRALNCIDGLKDEIRFDIVPSAVFTRPECGMVGKTEEQCKIEGTEVMIGQSFFRANGKALTMGEPDGLCKLIFNKADEKLIGAHIMGVEAADLAQQCADMMNAGATLHSMEQIIFSHPSVSEVIMAALHAVKK